MRFMQNILRSTLSHANNDIGLLHEYWGILSRAVYHIARACEYNMIYCEGNYSPIFMQYKAYGIFYINIVYFIIFKWNFELLQIFIVELVQYTFYQYFCLFVHTQELDVLSIKSM